MDTADLPTLFTQSDLVLPEFLTVALTEQCNLACSHCWFEAGPNRSKIYAPEDSLRVLLREFVQLGGQGLRLTGGEPMLHPYWRELLGFAAGLGLEEIILQTNGLLLEEADIQLLTGYEPALLRIQISLDGAKPVTHEAVRGAGTFAPTLKVIERLVAAGLGLQVSLFFTEMQHNLAELPDLFDLAAALGVGEVTSGCLVACGRARDEQQIRPPQPEQYLALLDRYQRDENFRRHYEEFGCVAPIEWCRSDRPDGGGCSFVKTPYLTATGTLYPCLMCQADDYAVISVYQKGFRAALREGCDRWRELQKLSRRRVTELDECQQCSLLTRCAGGCMGRAWGSFGQFLVVEDRCQQRKAVDHWNKSAH